MYDSNEYAVCTLYVYHPYPYSVSVAAFRINPTLTFIVDLTPVHSTRSFRFVCTAGVEHMGATFPYSERV